MPFYLTWKEDWLWSCLFHSHLEILSNLAIDLWAIITKILLKDPKIHPYTPFFKATSFYFFQTWKGFLCYSTYIFSTNKYKTLNVLRQFLLESFHCIRPPPLITKMKRVKTTNKWHQSLFIPRWHMWHTCYNNSFYILAGIINPSWYSLPQNQTPRLESSSTEHCQVPPPIKTPETKTSLPFPSLTGAE